MTHLLQVGVGSGGMPVLDALSRNDSISRITIIEPDVYKEHNVERHLFPLDAVGADKADLAKSWLLQRRPDLTIDVLKCDLLEDHVQEKVDTFAAECDLGICAVDNEPAKYHWDRLMRKHHKPWTLGEVLSGGIGGFVHWFVPDGPCYGCVASYLKRSVIVDKPEAPDYSQPGGPVEETRLPASMASIHVIASLHALITLDLLTALQSVQSFDPGFTSMLFTLQKVPDVFEQTLQSHRFNVPRLEDCLICRALEETTPGENLDEALEQALSRFAEPDDSNE